jgi:hypothetical protein
MNGVPIMTNDLRKAAEMALEALQKIYIAPEHEEYIRVWWPKCEEAIEALRQALAQQDKECVAIVNEGMGGIEWLSPPLPDDTPLYAAPPHYWGNVTNAELVEELRRRDMLMVPVKEQEPEWIDDDFGTMWQKCGKKDCGKFVVRVGKVDCWNGDCPEKEPKLEWVGLTEDEFESILKQHNEAFPFAVYQSIEAKLKEKNGYE